MPLPVIDNVGRVAFKFETGGSGPSPTVNVMHFRKASGDAWSTIAGLLGTALDHSTAVGIWRAIAGSYAFTEFTLTPLDGSTASFTVSGAGHTWPTPGGGGEPMPARAAINKFRTAKRGRSYRGRSYLGPVGESDCNAGFISSSVKTTSDAAWVAWFNHLISAISLEPVVASYLHRSAELITDVGIHSRLGTQRRRQHY